MSTQEELLLSLVQGAEGKEWAASRVGWRISPVEPACNWEGVICDSSDRETVTSIHLAETDFFGTLPKELGQMKSLKSINMRRNLIIGSIPPEISTLPNLEEIDLGENKITGTLPVLTSHVLTSVKLDQNDLIGTLPDNQEYYYQSMTEFIVMKNHLSGTIPPYFFQQMPRISAINLSENDFSGVIPDELGNFQFLQFLYLDNNYFVGYIPSSIAKPHTDNQKVTKMLEEIWLQSNMLSGTIPPAFATLEMKDFFVDGNKLTGSIPPDLCRPSLNADFFDGISQIKIGNKCNAVACPAGTSSIDGVYPCRPCNSKYYNPYIGRTGQCIVLNQRVILNNFYKSTTIGGLWNGNNNWGNDDIFVCNFSGVTCDENNRVIGINLSRRGLKGTIPEDLGFLEHLQILDLSYNEISGFLPSDLRWAPLEKLDVAGNNIRGIIPPTLCLKAGVNDNGEDGDYNCKKIACPSGMFSPSGRETSAKKCEPCTHPNNMFIASTSCVSLQSNNSDQEITPVAVVLIIAFALTIGTLISLFISFKRKGNNTYKNYELTQQETERNAMMDEYVANVSFRKNSKAVSSLPHPEERKGLGRKSNVYKINSGSLRSASRVNGKMPPADDPLFIGTFPASEDNNSILSSASQKSSKSTKTDSTKVMWLDVPEIE